MDQRRINQMKALIAQAVAESHHNHENPRLLEVHLIAYGDIAVQDVLDLYAIASQGTPAEHAIAKVQDTGTRYICWNCCGLRFESLDGVCPNCGEVALEVPGEISFALRSIKVEEAN